MSSKTILERLSMTSKRFGNHTGCIRVFSTSSVRLFGNLLHHSHKNKKCADVHDKKSWMHVKTLQLLPFGSHPSLIIPGCFLGRKSAKQLVEVKNPQVLKTKIVNFRSIIQKMIRFNPDVRMIPMPRARRNWSALQNRKHLLFLYWKEKQFWLKIYTQNRSMFCSLADASIFTGSGHRSDDQQSSALF